MNQLPFIPKPGDPGAFASLHCVEISHRTASADIRERMAFPSDSVPSALRAAKRDGIERLVILSTCHRTELYAEMGSWTDSGGSTGDAERRKLCEWLARATGVEPAVIEAHAQGYTREAAARHLFRLAAGLESIVPGEPQIITQIAQALRQSVACHAASPGLKRLFKEAVRVGEKARSTAWGGHRSANIGTAAVEATMQSLEQSGRSVSNSRISVFGAGELADLILSALGAAGAGDITVVNRSLERGAMLAERHELRARPLSDLSGCLVESDAAIFCLSGSRSLVGTDTLTSVMTARQHSVLTVIDVALPRNVDPAAKEIPRLTLFDIDDISKLGKGLFADRVGAIESVASLVDDGLMSLLARGVVAQPAPALTLLQQ